MNTFVWNGQAYVYLRHPYNRAYANMRAVEVPVTWAVLKRTLRRNRLARILEVGNVLAHYGRTAWPVLDVREMGPGVVNADVMAWEPGGPLDLIVSVSTVEHIGFGGYARYTAPTTPAAVLARLRSWLAPGGQLLATVPLAYNPALDEALRAGTLGADRLWFMRRVAEPNRWAECSQAEALAMPYRTEAYRWGGALAIILCRRKT